MHPGIVLLRRGKIHHAHADSTRLADFDDLVKLHHHRFPFSLGPRSIYIETIRPVVRPEQPLAENRTVVLTAVDCFDQRRWQPLPPGASFGVGYTAFARGGRYAGDEIARSPAPLLARELGRFQDRVHAWKQRVKRLFESRPPQIRDLPVKLFMRKTLRHACHIIRVNADEDSVRIIFQPEVVEQPPVLEGSRPGKTAIDESGVASSSREYALELRAECVGQLD